MGVPALTSRSNCRSRRRRSRSAHLPGCRACQIAHLGSGPDILKAARWSGSLAGGGLSLARTLLLDT
eukprot:4043964-Alexandrium_andersonii.AAC.1